MSQPERPSPAPQIPRLPEAAEPMRRLFRYLRPYRRTVRSAVGASVINKVLDMMPPLLVGWVIDSLRGVAPGWISALAGTRDPWRLAVVLAGLSVAIFFFESLFQWLYQ
ncbi:MAG TPA: ABC transporter, partial [Thermoanaerobaculia bacterium]|nr:ABC transporter [Thermoanaerobaculia bacterium]